jgi:LPS O-antigen subunit length determinant protein (WzzB/FepE family)
MHKESQNIYPNTNHVVNLKNIITFLIERRFFLFTTTGLFTILAFIVSINIKPAYKVTSFFTLPNESALYEINKSLNETRESVFSQFLDILSSKEFQKKIFLEGNYLAQLDLTNESNDEEILTENILNFININMPNVSRQELMLNFLVSYPYSISIETTSPKVFSKYIDALIAAADKKTINYFITLNELNISNSIEELSVEISLELIKEKTLRLNKIELLTEAAQIAGSQGISTNNFNQLNALPIFTSSDQNFLNTESLPLWYLTGEKALLKEIEILKKRNDKFFISKLASLEEQISKLNLINFDPNVNAVTINQTAEVAKYSSSPSTTLLVMLAFSVSFIVSIFWILVTGFLKSNQIIEN